MQSSHYTFSHGISMSSLEGVVDKGCGVSKPQTNAFEADQLHVGNAYVHGRRT